MPDLESFQIGHNSKPLVQQEKLLNLARKKGVDDIPKFMVRIEQDVPEVAFEVVEALDAEEAIEKTRASPNGPYCTGDSFKYDVDAGIHEREVVNAKEIKKRE